MIKYNHIKINLKMKIKLIILFLAHLGDDESPLSQYTSSWLLSHFSGVYYD